MPRFPDALSDEGQGDAAVFPRRFAFSGPSGPRPAGGDIPPLPPGPEAVFFGPRNRYVNLPAFRKQTQAQLDPFDMGDDDDGMLFDIAGSRTEPATPDHVFEPGERYSPVPGLDAVIPGKTGSQLRRELYQPARPYSHPASAPSKARVPLPGSFLSKNPDSLKDDLRNHLTEYWRDGAVSDRSASISAPFANSHPYPDRAGEMRSYDASIEEKAKYRLADGMRAMGMNSYGANRQAGKLTELLGFVPGPDMVLPVMEAFRNPTKANIAIAMASVAPIPGAPKALQKALRAGEKARQARILKGDRIPPYLRRADTREQIARKISHVMMGKADQFRYFRRDLGEAVVDFGKAGNPRKKFKDGNGLVHIEAGRQAKDKDDGWHYVTKILPEVLANGRLTRFVEKEVRNKKNEKLNYLTRRAVIENKSDIAFLPKYRMRGKVPHYETWLLTGYTKGKK